MLGNITISDNLNREDWLKLRSLDVTSTEVAALFGLSPYITEFELWHRKKNNIVEAFEADDRVRWGNRLERAISHGLAEDYGWQLTSMEGSYISAPDIRLGASFDNQVVDTVRGVGLAEIKNVDFIRFRSEWNEKDDEAPDHIELQLQTQMLLMDVKWGCLAALVGGNNLKVFIRERDEEIGQAIIKKVQAFWKSIEENKEPTPNFNRDYNIISMIYDKRDKTKTADLPDLETKFLRYKKIKEEEKVLEAESNEIKATLLASADGAGKVFAGSMQASIAKVEGTADSYWTREELDAMLDQVKKGRAGYTRITINDRKV